MLKTAKTSNRKTQPAQVQEKRPNKTQEKSTSGKKPDLIAYDVRDVPGRERGVWTRVGAVWMHRDGQGADLLLQAVPLAGRIVLRAHVEKPDQRSDNPQY